MVLFLWQKRSVSVMALFELDDHIASHSSRTPSHATLITELATLIHEAPPQFTYIYTPTSPRLTTNVVLDILHPLPGLYCAMVNATTCFSSRLIYDAIINSLVDHAPSWEEGCANWAGESPGVRWNENIDGFLHGLRAVERYLRQKETRKGKAKAMHTSSFQHMVIIVENAEKLEDNAPELVTVFSRLRDLSRTNIAAIFISSIQWEDMRPEFGAALEPYYVDVLAPSKEVIVQQLLNTYASLSQLPTPENIHPNTYHHSLLVVYKQYASTLVDVCYTTTRNPDEISYIAAACWPNYIKPILDSDLLAVQNSGGSNGYDFALPDEGVRLRLLKLFAPTFQTALEVLLPRATHASSWREDNQPPADVLSQPFGYKLPTSKVQYKSQEDQELVTLPKMAKYLLIASFIASTNPARSDLRMFQRGRDEKKKKRKGGGRKAGGAKNEKVPQRLLGPAPFPLDRLLAILGALLENNDVETRLDEDPNFTIAGEETDMEVLRTGISGMILHLISLRLLHRTSAADKLDGPSTFKCGISFETALSLSNQLKVDLRDLIWETV